jgi:hypothetical protein
MSDYDDDLYDKYEAQPGNANVAPVVSWKKADPGDGFSGILLPALPVDRPDKGYEVRREYKQENKEKGTPAGYTVWPPRGNKEKIKTPVVEAVFAELWPDLDISDPKVVRRVAQNHFTFETGLQDASFLSGRFKERCAEQDPPKDPTKETRRRVIEQGKSLTEQIDKALKRVGGKPLIGQTWHFKLVARTPNDMGGETSSYSVDILAPTAETKAVVTAYIEAEKIKAAEAADADDPDDKYAGIAKTEDPPF